MEKKTSKLRFLIHNRTLLKYVFRNKKAENNATTLEEKEKIICKYTFNYKFDFEHPRTFNEHLVWLKLHYRNDLWKKCADKLGAKEFLEEKGFGQYLPKTYKVYSSSSEIDLDELPDKFVLKTNHDCGSIFLCEKGKTNFKSVFQKLDDQVKKKYSDKNGEWVYEDIEPKIFAEEMLIPANGNDLIDYKMFVFHGRFGFGFTGQNRFKDIRFTLFDRNFNFYKTEYIYLKPRKKDMPIKPICWDEMINLAETIGDNFEFVRVDLYWTKFGPRIGELTFFSESGHGQFTNKKYDFDFGKLFLETSFK